MAVFAGRHFGKIRHDRLQKDSALSGGHPMRQRPSIPGCVHQEKQHRQAQTKAGATVGEGLAERAGGESNWDGDRPNATREASDEVSLAICSAVGNEKSLGAVFGSEGVNPSRARAHSYGVSKGEGRWRYGAGVEQE